MIKTDEQMEDADIRSAINSIASYTALRYKRNMIQQMETDIQSEIMAARLQGASIDTTELFLRLAEKYAS